MRKLRFQALLCLVLLFSLTSCVEEIEYFKAVEIEQVFSSANGNINKLHFVDDQTGYAYNKNTIFQTTDGGTTWQNIATFSSFEIKKLEFPAKGTGYILGNDTRMYKSTDGGKTWSQMKTNTYDNRGIDNFSFADANVGATTSSGDMYLTINGGSTWTYRDISGFNQFNDVFSFDKDHILLFEDNNNKLYYTIDGGKNFNSDRYYGPYWDIHRIDSSTAFITGGSEVWIITDKGETISKVSGPSFIKTSFPISQSSWFLSGDIYFNKTMDAGMRYEEFFNEEGATISFDELWFFNSLNGLGVKDNIIYKIKLLEE